MNFNKTIIIGILNVTPDSFSDGGLFADAGAAFEHAMQMVKDGADIIDIGGESSRPGSETVSEEDELRRVLPVVERLANESNVPVSIDTYKPKVAEACLKEGAHMINDITGLRNWKMIRLAAEYGVPVVIMHMKGNPKTMQEAPAYEDVVKEIKDFFTDRINEARKQGVNEIILDPGIGFGKTTLHNLQILKRLNEFKFLQCPILVGTSRKSFIGNISDLPVRERLEGTLASVAISVANGADMVRVHDVKACRRAVQIADAVRRA